MVQPTARASAHSQEAMQELEVRHSSTSVNKEDRRLCDFTLHLYSFVCVGYCEPTAFAANSFLSSCAYPAISLAYARVVMVWCSSPQCTNHQAPLYTFIQHSVDKPAKVTFLPQLCTLNAVLSVYDIALVFRSKQRPA